MKTLKIMFIVMMSFAGFAAAGPGKSGAGFLSLGNGARATGMGEAQTAIAEGANSVYWNPAGLGLTSSHDLTLTHIQHFEDVSQQYAALAIPVKKGRYGGVGFSVTHFSIADIEARDAQSALASTVEQKNLNLQLAYGLRVLGGEPGFDREGIYLGVGLKRISEELAGVSAETLAYDAGLQYRPGPWMAGRAGEWVRRGSLGVSALHMGNGLKFDREEAKLPQTVRFGLGYTHFLWGDALNVAADVSKPRDDSEQVSAGAEFWIRNTFAMRVGYVEKQDVGSTIRAGAGFRFQNIDFDYAWAGFGEELGDTHRLSLGFRFGEGALRAPTGLKSDLVQFHLSRAQDHLASGFYHEAILEVNRVLGVDPKNADALQILIQAGEKMKPVDPLPSPATGTNEAP